jgi:hypothetical protein
MGFEHDFKQYVVKQGAGVEARPYKVGEDVSKISVQPGYTPKEGDMVCRNPKNRDDQWLVEKEFFQGKYELMDKDF